MGDGDNKEYAHINIQRYMNKPIGKYIFSQFQKISLKIYLLGIVKAVVDVLK